MPIKNVQKNKNSSKIDFVLFLPVDNDGVYLGICLGTSSYAGNMPSDNVTNVPPRDYRVVTGKREYGTGLVYGITMAYIWAFV